MTTQLALACCPPSALSAVRLDRTLPQRDASRKMREGSLTSRRPAKAPAGRRPRPRQQSAVSKTSSSTLKAQASCGLRLAGSRPVGPISRLATEEGARLERCSAPQLLGRHSLGGTISLPGRPAPHRELAPRIAFPTSLLATPSPRRKLSSILTTRLSRLRRPPIAARGVLLQLAYTIVRSMTRRSSGR